MDWMRTKKTAQSFKVLVDATEKYWMIDMKKRKRTRTRRDIEDEECVGFFYFNNVVIGGLGFFCKHSVQVPRRDFF